MQIFHRNLSKFNFFETEADITSVSEPSESVYQIAKTLPVLPLVGGQGGL